MCHAAGRRCRVSEARGQFHLDRVAIHRDGARLALHAAGLEVFHTQLRGALPSQVGAIGLLVAGGADEGEHRLVHRAFALGQHENAVAEGVGGTGVDFDQHGVQPAVRPNLKLPKSWYCAPCCL